MKLSRPLKTYGWKILIDRCRNRSYTNIFVSNVFAVIAVVLAFYLTLVATSAAVETKDLEKIESAIAVLEQKGFSREVFLLKHFATFRSSQNWLNSLTVKESVYATTNYPFGIITIYEDFYTKAEDDTERAMILLHEVQHLQGGSEAEAYEYIWKNRRRLGWTLLSHGSTPTYITVDILTRENAPELFICPAKMFGDCTENLQLTRKLAKVTKY